MPVSRKGVDSDTKGGVGNLRGAEGEIRFRVYYLKNLFLIKRKGKKNTEQNISKINHF